MYYNSDDYDDNSMDGKNSMAEPSSIIRNKIKHGRDLCAICGAKAAGVNFDVLTCSSCKAFFRRNGVKPLHQFICRSSGQCTIDERSRRQCTACRLRKCFSMGMVKERIRTEEQNQRHRALVEENRRQKVVKYHQQQEEKRLKVFHAQRRQLIYSTTVYNPSNDIDCIYDLFLDNTENSIPDDFNFLFDDDLTDVMNLYCIPISCLITFLKQIYRFQQLTIDDRLLVLKNNIKILLPLLTNLLHTTYDIEICINHAGLQNINNKIFYAQSLFSDIIPDDNKLLTLLIVVFIFCPCLFTNNSLYDAGHINQQSRQLIQCAYDEYTQLLWFYVLEKCFDNEEKAILLYMKIVTTFLQLQNVSSQIYDTVECSVQIDRLHMMMQSILHVT